MKTASSRQGFTLVELLVVIGIIAVLLSILLPALGGVRRRAQSAACMSNMRQLAMAMNLFATDNKGHLPRPYLVDDVPTPEKIKTYAYLQKTTSTDGHIDLDDNTGALWKYIKGKETRGKVVWCPGDDGELMQGFTTAAGYPRNFSYSLNQYINQYAPNNTEKHPGIKITKVKESSSRIMIYEEFAPNDTWCIIGFSSDDHPSGRHGAGMKSSYRSQPQHPEYRSKGRGNFAFFDGHVESLSPKELLPGTGSWSYHAPLKTGDPLNFP